MWNWSRKYFVVMSSRGRHFWNLQTFLDTWILQWLLLVASIPISQSQQVLVRAQFCNPYRFMGNRFEGPLELSKQLENSDDVILEDFLASTSPKQYSTRAQGSISTQSRAGNRAQQDSCLKIIPVISTARSGCSKADWGYLKSRFFISI